MGSRLTFLGLPGSVWWTLGRVMSATCESQQNFDGNTAKKSGLSPFSLRKRKGLRCIIAVSKHLGRPKGRVCQGPSSSRPVVIPSRKEPMRILRSALAIIILFSSFAAVSESAKSLYNKGVDADARQDYEAAYEYYKAAYEKNPKDLKYRVPYQRTRFLAAASKVHRGQKLREAGKLQEALELFQQAAQIDPTNDLAQQKMRRTQQMMGGQQPSAQTSGEPKQPRAEYL